MMPETAWTAGRLGASSGARRLLFGRMYEDAEIEQVAFEGKGRVFCIASTGSTALRLADRHEVVACDINPVQLAYAERRARGGTSETGDAERVMNLARLFMPLVGWRTDVVRAFLALSDVAEQMAFWREYLDTRRFRAALDAMTSRTILRAAYAPRFLSATSLCRERQTSASSWLTLHRRWNPVPHSPSTASRYRTSWMVPNPRTARGSSERCVTRPATMPSLSAEPSPSRLQVTGRIMPSAIARCCGEWSISVAAKVSSRFTGAGSRGRSARPTMQIVSGVSSASLRCRLRRRSSALRPENRECRVRCPLTRYQAQGGNILTHGNDIQEVRDWDISVMTIWERRSP
jgi:hypothetical protein